MKKVSPIVISEFTNPSGEIVYRVYGRVGGERIRKNFATLAEAKAERDVLEVNWLQRDSGTRAAITRLTDEKKLADAVADYVAAKEHEFRQDQIFPPQMERIRGDLKNLVAAFPHKTVAEFTAAALTEFLERKRWGMKTHNNKRGILSTFFKHCFQRGWIAENPILKVPHFRRRRRKFSKLLRESHELDLSHDVLRHTFISMFVAKFRSIGEAAIQAGNSEAIIRKHYLDLKTANEADAFYAIVPKHAKAPQAAAPIETLPVVGPFKIAV